MSVLVLDRPCRSWVCCACGLVHGAGVVPGFVDASTAVVVAGVVQSFALCGQCERLWGAV